MADSGGRLVIGRVTVGQYTLEVGDSAGCVLSTASRSSRPGETCELRRAVAKRPGRRKKADPIERVKAQVDHASEVIDKIERASELFRQLATGEIGPGAVAADVDSLLALLQRLNGGERWDEALRVARCAAALLALLGRWAELLETLRAALEAAERAGDKLGQAWAHHELGTVQLAAGRHAEADRQLEAAHQIRRQAGDRAGLAVTERNLAVLCRTLRRMLHRRVRRFGRPPRSWVPTIVTAAASVIVGGGAAIALSGGGQPAPHPQPVESVAFSFVPSAPHAQQDIVFTASARDRRDPAASYEWQWGDGDPAPNPVQRHSYRASGAYVVKLIVRDARGRVIGEVVKEVTVQRPAIESGPNAYFTFSPHAPAAGRPVTFDAGSSYDPAGRIVGYSWSFGDGQSARGAHVSHAFASGGAHRVSLTVTDTSDQTNTTVQTVAVAQGAGERATAIRLLCPSRPQALDGSLAAVGSIYPARPHVPVTVLYRSPAGKQIPIALVSDAGGGYSGGMTPSEPGAWSVQSTLAEGGGYRPSASESCTVTVQREAASMSLICPPAEAPAGPIQLAGSIAPARAGASIVVTARSPAGAEIPLAASSAADGSYEATLTAREPGPWSAQSKLAEDSGHRASESSRCDFTVGKAGKTATSTVLRCPPAEDPPGRVAIAGTIEPARPTKVLVRYTRPSGGEGSTTLKPGAEGGYETTLDAEEAGPWSVTGSTPEDATHRSSTSSTCRFTVAEATENP